MCIEMSQARKSAQAVKAESPNTDFMGFRFPASWSKFFIMASSIRTAVTPTLRTFVLHQWR